jgi:hypothetical protein
MRTRPLSATRGWRCSVMAGEPMGQPTHEQLLAALAK